MVEEGKTRRDVGRAAELLSFTALRHRVEQIG